MQRLMRTTVAIGFAVALGGGMAAEAKPWSRAYVAEWLEPAWYFPGKPEGEAAPGEDCPKGANPALDKRTALKTSYRTWAEVDALLDPEKPQWTRNGAIRGPNRENVYEQPWLVPDTKALAPVVIDRAEGFDLDGDKTNGFKNVDGGAKGVDNNFYRMGGCWIAYRGPEKGGKTARYANEYMRNGAFSILMVVSGEGDDPDNDPNVKVAFHVSLDRLATGATGEILSGYSFRISQDPRFQSLVDARTVKGVIETKAPVDVQMHDQINATFFPPQLKLAKSQFRFKPSEDGRMKGVIGGYRSIYEYYEGWAAAGSTHESVTRIDIPALWYALHRYADYKMTPDAKEKDGISTAYRLFWVPAHAVEPDLKDEAKVARLYPGAEDPKLSRQGRPVLGDKVAAAPATTGGGSR